MKVSRFLSCLLIPGVLDGRSFGRKALKPPTPPTLPRGPGNDRPGSWKIQPPTGLLWAARWVC